MSPSHTDHIHLSASRKRSQATDPSEVIPSPLGSGLVAPMTATPRVGDSALARGSRAVACEIGLTGDSCGSVFLLAGGSAFRIDCRVVDAAMTKITLTMVMVAAAMRIVHLASVLRGVV